MGHQWKSHLSQGWNQMFHYCLELKQLAALSGSQMVPLLWPPLHGWIFSVQLTFSVPPCIVAEDVHPQSSNVGVLQVSESQTGRNHEASFLCRGRFPWPSIPRCHLLSCHQVYWLILCELDTSQSNLGRENFSQKNNPPDWPAVHFLDQ